MIESIDYGTQIIKFEITRSKLCKNTYITVERDIGVSIKTSNDSRIEEIKALVKSKAKWIIKKLEELGESIDYGKIVTGSRLFYMGKSYYIELIKEDRTNYEVEFIHSKFKIKVPMTIDQQSLNKAIEDFYKEKAIEKITKLVNKYSDIMKLFPQHLGFRKSKTKWASCSSNNRITFNPEVMKLSSSLIDYVVVHELSHIQYKNHSKDFWNLVKKHMNDYQKKEDILRGFEKKL
jgi:predicted metal-dependent hydrolase